MASAAAITQPDPYLSSHHVHPLAPSVQLRSDRHPYAHGGGFGKATEVIANAFWGELLHDLEPHRFEQCDRILTAHKRVLNALSAQKITLVMENSPVGAAFAQKNNGPKTLEWDIWLDSQEPDSLEKAKIEHGNLRVTLCPRMSSSFLEKSPSVTHWIRVYHTALRACQIQDENLSVCLDIKSTWSTAEDINRFVRNLQQRFPVAVRYVGSFSHRQISAIEGPETILFCHAVWDLKKKVASGEFSQQMMCNGADLLDQRNLATLRSITKKHESKGRDIQQQEIDPLTTPLMCRSMDLIDHNNLGALRETVEKHDLSIGIYVQEPQAETQAIQRLIRLVNEEPAFFRLGFALGNSADGRAPKMIEGSGAGVQAMVLTNNVQLIKKIMVVAALAFTIIIAAAIYQSLD